MDNKKILTWQIAGIFFTIIFGTILHFTYELSGNNPIVGIFSPVDESIGQHLKLVLTPFVIFSIIEFFLWGKNIPYFIIIQAFSVVIGMIAIPVLFYCYTWILGTHYLWADIAIFVISTIISYWISYSLLSNSQKQKA